MRSDMAKVLVNRPRGGGKYGREKDSLPGKLEDTPRCAPKRYAKTKWLSENFGPLKKFLRSQVGRKWNDVYSEISQSLRVTNAVQQHVRDHLNDFVSLRVKFVDGIPCRPEGTRWDDGMVRYFYVCPNSRRLVEHLQARKGGRRSIGKRGCGCADCRKRPKQRRNQAQHL